MLEQVHFNGRLAINFFSRLDTLGPTAKFKVVTRLGWNSGAFVLCNEIYRRTQR